MYFLCLFRLGLYYLFLKLKKLQGGDYQTESPSIFVYPYVILPHTAKLNGLRDILSFLVTYLKTKPRIKIKQTIADEKTINLLKLTGCFAKSAINRTTLNYLLKRVL